ncbi:hypothetical protein [Methylobacterium soli]|uniref:Uncharacterized protein n=1 Tax=Methylobacterium soli TaxID=553447 RepID=A0A6L3T9Z8_9HYPH|nr:hypothetical protein [Methylobacterium soli]KAB1080635.1 hypothetical protein F6X53_05495 [Methylobacterium soli]GJE41019.1 hypothetical protein AEGHOMDF_0178 [Methylobacterium soli]
MTYESLTVELTGTAPLLMRSARLVDPLDPISREIAAITRKRARTDADIARIDELEWTGGLWARSGVPCVPGEAIEAMVAEAAKLRRASKAVRAGFLVPEAPLLVYDGPQDLGDLRCDPRFRLRVPVSIGPRKIMRTRPRFPAGWRLSFEAHFLPDVLNPGDVREFLNLAGHRIGLGDWRPRFGRFDAQITARHSLA